VGKQGKSGRTYDSYNTGNEGFGNEESCNKEFCKKNTPEENAGKENTAKENAAKDNFGKKQTMFSVIKTAYTLITSLAVIVSLTSATYAWFSANSIVRTNRVVGRSGTDQVVLQVSQTGGENFRGAYETGLVQVNSTNTGFLLPVSTSDLTNYVYNAGTVEQTAVSFVKVTGERYYYHGRVYLRATAEGHSENARLALYLDGAESGGSLVKNAKGYLVNAARLGLTFDGGNRKILRLSEEANPEKDRTLNTVLNGNALSAGQVIDSSGSTFQAVTDPSEPLARYMVGTDGLTGNGTISPLLNMELNRVYAVDVFFYLEGCDPDCTDVTRMDELDLHLAFYGVLTEGEVR